MSRFQDGQFFNITVREGLHANTVYQILEDDRGFFWPSSSQGIFCVAGEELQALAAGKIRRLHCRSFTEADGLKSTVCSGGSQPAAWKASDGKLWFATLKGAAVMDPSQLLASGAPPPTVLIEQVAVDGRTWRPDEKQELDGGVKTIDFFFTAIDFVLPRKTVFRYKLEGFDEQWQETEKQRRVRYYRPPPGSYRFRVTVGTDSEIEAGNGAAFAFAIAPLFYKTVWFYSLLALGLASGAILLLVYRKRRYLKKKQEKYKFSTLTRQRAQAYLETLLETMEKEKPYLDPELTLAGLAQQISIPARHLSQLINERFALNFNDYINRHRIAEAKRMLLDPKTREFKLLKIAFDAGFNSKSAFNSAFKKQTGLSPSEFRETLNPERDD